MSINEVLHKIQQELKAPKNQKNTFGNYNYRSCEDILLAVKPLLPEDCVLLLTDSIINIGSHNYVEATAILQAGGDKATVTACAREAEKQTGMQDAQLTGSTSSYARKYALNGLFMIDDTKDSDATNTHGKGEKSSQSQNSSSQGNDKKATAPQVKFMAKKLFGKALEGQIILDEFKVKKLEDITMSKVNDVLEFIDNYEKK